jgi:prepilin-type N-terminal cleavage/methylation domain-containing protein
MSRRGFTLVELLLVVTIIVVLLALLTPALDKAIYEAELAACGATQKAITASATVAAMDYQRRYFDRTDLYSPHMVMIAGGTDHRPQFRAYLGSLNKLLLCPLNPEVDLERSLASSHTYGNFWTFFGAAYRGPGGGGGMTHVGKRWIHDGRAYGVMTTDYYVQTSDGAVQWSTHPDSDGVLPQARLQDSGGYTFSGHAGGGRPGTVDLNTSYQDGSVQRFRTVRALDLPNSVKDDRMDLVNNFFDTNNVTQLGIVPAR